MNSTFSEYKKFRCIAACLLAALVLVSCSDFTDIEPKGMNLLKTTNDLDLLFNNEMTVVDKDMCMAGGSVIAGNTSITAAIEQTNKTRNAYLYCFADTPDDMTRFEILTSADAWYTNFYNFVGRIANPVLAQLPSASGTEAEKKALKAEALALRAYCHYMVLQKFAKAYHPATAANDPGIAFMKEGVEATSLPQKNTVAEVYQFCLDDINAAIDLNAMPEKQVTLFRMDKAAMYAVKALICLNMQKYDDAKAAAEEALKTNDTLYDYYKNAQEVYGGGTYLSSQPASGENPETYFLMPNTVTNTWVQPEIAANFEPGYATYSLFPTMLKIYEGISITMPAFAYMEDFGASMGLPGWDSGSYTSDYISMSGLNSPMMYLVIAECELQKGSVDSAMEHLDRLRAKRLSPTTFQPLKGNVTDINEAIAYYKKDYIAENIWTPWVFIGRKRWNADPEWSETLTRTIGETVYNLTPGSNLWVFPIPGSVRQANPHMTSNNNQ